MPYFPPQQTALDILNKLKTVDGSGSGLDADTIDGLHANELSTVATLNDLTDVIITSPSSNQLLQYNGTNWVNATVSLGEGSGVTDHGALTGLSDDDHSQYLLATGSRIGASSSRQVFTSGITTGSIRPSSDSTTALQLQKADGTAVVTVDTTNKRLGVDVVPTEKLTVAGVIRTTGRLQVTGATVPSSRGGFELAYDTTGDGGSGWGSIEVYAPGSTNPRGWLQSSKYFRINTGATLGALALRFQVTENGYAGIGVDPVALLDLAASTVTRASLRIRSGTAPTSPNDGDIWYDGTHLYCRIAGVTKQLDN